MAESIPDATGFSGPFSQLSQRMIVDVRVSPVMTHCTKCGAELPESQTTSANPDHGVLMFVQCGECKCVFIQDFASFQC
jgi:hypothetical protein